MYFFTTNHFGVVAAAIQREVDGEDHLPHLFLRLMWVRVRRPAAAACALLDQGGLWR
jgi:hypothetical protein